MNSLTHGRFFAFFVLATFFPFLLISQTNLVLGQEQGVGPGTPTDYTIPAMAGTLAVTLRGGDGGGIRFSGLICDNTVQGGSGATVSTTFEVGFAAGQLQPGGRIRVMVGQKGWSDSKACLSGEASYAGGGGSSAILYLPPNADPTGINWRLLAVAGAGGGASRPSSGIDRTGGGATSGDPSGSVNGIAGAYGGYNGNWGDDNPFIVRGLPGAGYLGGTRIPSYALEWGGNCEEELASNCVGYYSMVESANPSASPILVKLMDNAYYNYTGSRSTASNNFKNGGNGFTGGGAGSTNVIFGPTAGGGGGGFSGGSVNYYFGGGGGSSYVTSGINTSNTTTNGGSNGAPGHNDGFVRMTAIAAPIITQAICQNQTVQLDGSGQASFSVSQLNNGSTGFVPLTYTVNGQSTFNFTCADVGTMGVTMTLTDVYGTTSTCSATITVQDNVGPTATCQDVTVQLNAMGNGMITTCSLDGGSADACGGFVGYSASQTTFNCDDLGTASVTLTVTDVNGNASNCTSTVTVQDNIRPVATCQNTTVQIDGNGSASISPDAVRASASDACGITGYSLNTSNFTCSDLGANTVMLTVTDGSGNSSTCSATVTVENTAGPSALCQDATVQLDANGYGILTVQQIDAGSSDACGIASRNLSQTSFSCADVGTPTVTLTVSNSTGQSSSCTANVNVVDGVAPTAQCQDITVQAGSDGFVTVNASQFDNGSSDLCGLEGVYYDNNSSSQTFSCNSPDPTYAINLVVRDNAGNTSNCSVNLTVEDIIAPVAGCEDITIQLDANGQVSIQGDWVSSGSSDGCGIAGFALDQSSFTCDEVGPNTVTLTVTDVNGLTGTCTATVTVEDNVAPVATCPGFVDNSAQNPQGGALSALVVTRWQSFTVQNTGTLSSFDALLAKGYQSGPTTAEIAVRVYAGEGLGGNLLFSTSHTVNLDNTNSWETLFSNVAIPVQQGSQYTVSLDVTGVLDLHWFVNGNNPYSGGRTGLPSNWDYAFRTHVEVNTPVTVQPDANGMVSLTPDQIDGGSSDACGIVSRSLSQTNFTCADTGENTVVLTVTDAHGNTNNCTATVLIDGAPIARCKDITVRIEEDGDVIITPEDVEEGSSVPCSLESMSISNNYFYCETLGTYPVELTITDSYGQSSSCTSMVTVDGAPIAGCKDITVRIEEDGDVIITPEDVEEGSSVPCFLESMSISNNYFYCELLGTYPVELTITDNYGQSSSCTSMVTVDGAPIAGCKDITVRIEEDGDVIITPEDVEEGSSVPCFLESMSISNNYFYCELLGTYPVELTITDNYGQSSSCTSMVTVDGAPIAGCKDITVHLEEDGDVIITPEDVEEGSSVPCFLESMSISNNYFYCELLGTYPVELTITDNYGQSSSCTSMVTVDGAPMAHCKDITVQLGANGDVQVDPSAIDNDSWVPCFLDDMTLSIGYYDCSMIGDNTETLTVTDYYNQSSSCTATVTVEDVIKPNFNQSTSALDLYTEGGADCPNSANIISLVRDRDNPLTVGNVPVPYTVAGMPFETPTAAISDNCTDASNIQVFVWNVQLDYDGNATDYYQQVRVVFRIEDESGNTRNRAILYNIYDNTAPVLECTENLILSFNGEEAIAMSEIADQLVLEASDNCGDVNLSFSPASIDCASVGETVHVTVTACDEADPANCTTCEVAVEVSGLPCNWTQETDGVGCEDGSQVDYDAQADEFIVSSTDCYNPITPTSDEYAFAQYTLCGNGSIVAQVTNITGNGAGWAGVTMRADNGALAPQVSLMTNSSNRHRADARQTQGGAMTSSISSSFNRHWLWIERNGNNFTGRVSPNGVAWFQKFSFNIPMPDCIEVGLIVNSAAAGGENSATFANVSVGGAPGTQMAVLPTPGDQVQFGDRSFSVYPNPTNGQVTIQLADFLDQEGELLLLNGDGRQLQSVSQGVLDQGTERIDLSHLPAGLYFVQLRLADGTIQTQRVVLQARP